MAESVNAFYKAELITMQGPWRNVDDVELATLSWVHWWNNVPGFARTGGVDDERRSTRRARPRGTRGLTGKRAATHHSTRPQGGNVSSWSKPMDRTW